MREILGIVSAMSISSVSTYSIVNSLHTIPGGIVGTLVIVSISGFVGGFASKDKKAGFLSGLLAGILAPLIYVQVSLRALHVLIFRFVLFGVVAGALGILGSTVSGQKKN